MYEYLCDLCKVRFSKEYSVILTKNNKWHCVYCISEIIENFGYHCPERQSKIERLGEEYTEDIISKLASHKV